MSSQPSSFDRFKQICTSQSQPKTQTQRQSRDINSVSDAVESYEEDDYHNHQDFHQATVQPQGQHKHCQQVTHNRSSQDLSQNTIEGLKKQISDSVTATFEMVAGDIRQILDAKEKDQFEKMIKISTDQNPAIRYLYQQIEEADDMQKQLFATAQEQVNNLHEEVEKVKSDIQLLKRDLSNNQHRKDDLSQTFTTFDQEVTSEILLQLGEKFISNQRVDKLMLFVKAMKGDQIDLCNQGQVEIVKSLYLAALESLIYRESLDELDQEASKEATEMFLEQLEELIPSKMFGFDMDCEPIYQTDEGDEKEEEPFNQEPKRKRGRPKGKKNSGRVKKGKGKKAKAKKTYNRSNFNPLSDVQHLPFSLETVNHEDSELNAENEDKPMKDRQAKGEGIVEDFMCDDDHFQVASQTGEDDEKSDTKSLVDQLSKLLSSDRESSADQESQLDEFNEDEGDYQDCGDPVEEASYRQLMEAIKQKKRCKQQKDIENGGSLTSKKLKHS